MTDQKITFGMPVLAECASLDENIALCRRLGLDFIELNMNFPDYGIEALERVSVPDGLFFTIHLDENLNIADFNPLVAEAYRETVRRAVAAAKRIGAPVINMHMHHGIHLTLPDRKLQLYDRYFDVYFDSFKRFAEMCEECVGDSGIKITVENTDGFKGYEVKVVEYLLKSPVFALTWDIGHSKAAGETDEPFLMAHGDRLAHFHIHDGRETPPANHLALGDGEIDLPTRLALARELGCRCVVETKTVAALEKSVKWLDERGYRG